MKESYTIKNHNSFGGLIYGSDFDIGIGGKTNNRSSMAARICSDWKFDLYCKNNIKARQQRNIQKENQRT